MSTLLDTVAVSRRSGEDAKEIFGAYYQTAPEITLNKMLEAEAAPEVSVQPKTNTAGDKLIEPR